MSTEAQQMLDAAFAGKLDLDADADQALVASAPTPEAIAETPVPAEPSTPQAAQAVPTAQDDEQAGAPIASKSGDYTIPYEKLSQARHERDTVKAENDQLKAQLAILTTAQTQNIATAQQQAQARADAGHAPTQADQNLAAVQAAVAQGADLAAFGDFDEQGIANGVAQLVEQRATALVDAKLEAALAPFKARDDQLQHAQAAATADAHTAAIYEAHKDADEIFESAEFNDWRARQSGFMQTAITHTLEHGSAKEIVDVFSAFKAATTKAAPAADDAVKAALAAAKVQPPVSLSELTGASSAAASDSDRLAALADNPAAMLDYMAGLSPEKQNRLMNSVV